MRIRTPSSIFFSVLWGKGQGSSSAYKVIYPGDWKHCVAWMFSVFTLLKCLSWQGLYHHKKVNTKFLLTFEKLLLQLIFSCVTFSNVKKRKKKTKPKNNPNSTVCSFVVIFVVIQLFPLPLCMVWNLNGAHGSVDFCKVQLHLLMTAEICSAARRQLGGANWEALSKEPENYSFPIPCKSGRCLCYGFYPGEATEF